MIDYLFRYNILTFKENYDKITVIMKFVLGVEAECLKNLFPIFPSILC